MVSTPRRISSLQAVTPTKPAPPRTSALVISSPSPLQGRGLGRGAWNADSWSDVSRRDLNIHAVDFRKPPGHLAGHRDGPMPAAGASECNHELRASVVPVVRNG